MSVQSEDKASKGGIGEWVTVLFHAAIIAIVIRTFLFQPFNIPSGSMIPTLLIGDYLFVSKYSYGYSNFSLPFAPNLITGRLFGSAPARGDVVVFRHPKQTDQDFIKRVIGLPGDRIQVVDGVLQVNGVRVQVSQVGTIETTNRWGRPAPTPLLRETLPGGVSHAIIEIEGSAASFDNTRVFQVPSGHMFVMGDNRDNSTDSRSDTVGFVPFENVVGRAEIIFFSIEEGERAWQIWNWPWTVRWDRMFQRVR